jgi:hypothetical protein
MVFFSAVFLFGFSAVSGLARELRNTMPPIMGPMTEREKKSGRKKRPREGPLCKMDDIKNAIGSGVYARVH